jgi:hypothetical protein
VTVSQQYAVVKCKSPRNACHGRSSGELQKESTDEEVMRTVQQARQSLDIAVQLLYLCEDQLKSAHAASTKLDGLQRNPATCQADMSKNPAFSSLTIAQNSHAEKGKAAVCGAEVARVVQRRVNELMYNASVVDSLDISRGVEAKVAAKRKLQEILSRAAGDGCALPVKLEENVLLLLGKLFMDLENFEEAKDTCEPLFVLSQHARPGLLYVGQVNCGRYGSNSCTNYSDRYFRRNRFDIDGLIQV